VGQQKANYRITAMGRVLGVSSSGYYAWCKGGLSERAKRDMELTSKIRHIHQASLGSRSRGLNARYLKPTLESDCLAEV
jgi:hypothetical protein